MTGASIAREALWTHQNTRLQILVRELFGDLSARVPPEEAAEAPQYPLRFPALQNHPAFTRKFNATLVALGMDATERKHRGLVR